MVLRFGVPNVPDSNMIPMVIVLSLVLAYGYLKLEKWGYWLMMVYSFVFLSISLVLAFQYRSQPFTGNALWSIIVIVYTYRKRYSFVS